MLLFFFVLFSGFFLFFKLFSKKLMCLLSLELLMITIIILFMLWSFSNSGDKSSFISFLFVCFMVLDSTLGISFLVSTSRSSFIFSSVLD